MTEEPTPEADAVSPPTQADPRPATDPDPALPSARADTAPTTDPDPALRQARADAGPSTDLVLPARRALVVQPRRWPEVVVRARGRLAELRQNPAAMATVSAAATVGSALVTAGLRRALRESPAGRTTAVTLRGHVVHEVHVVHHVVHHVIRPPAD